MKLGFLGFNLLFVLSTFASNAFGQICSKVGENQFAPISCPSGQVITGISFASYGNPKGSCGNLRLGSCNASSSKSILQSNCIGKSSCSVQASNSVFGDPCPRVNKSLAVQVTCGTVSTTTTTVPAPTTDPNWVRCATESGSCSFTGTRNVRYGANGSFLIKSAVIGPVVCSNSSFGGDPAVGVTKYCDYSASTVSSPTTTTTMPPATTTTTTTSTTTTTVPAPAPAPSGQGSNIVPASPIAIPANTLPVPTNIANGSTVSLQCGQVYRGTLDLNNKSNVTVNVAGTCGKPTIIPTSASSNGINAAYSSFVTINGIKIQGSTYGIFGETAKNLTIQNVDIVNSSEAGIYLSGSDRMVVKDTSVNHSGHTGLDSLGWVSNATITNVTVNDSGYAGGAYRGIGFYIYNGSNNKLDHVTATNSVYHGIVVIETPGSSLTNSVAKNSCTGADHDCGAIYLNAKSQTVQNIIVDSNRADGSGGMGIYLDDSSNAVTVTNNDVLNCERGMLLHNAYNTVIQYNRLSGNRVVNFELADDLARMTNNQFSYNTVAAVPGVIVFNQATKNLGRIMTSDYNTYKGSSTYNFARSWDFSSAGIDYTYSVWKSNFGQDAHSTFSP